MPPHTIQLLVSPCIIIDCRIHQTGYAFSLVSLLTISLPASTITWRVLPQHPLDSLFPVPTSQPLPSGSCPVSCIVLGRGSRFTVVTAGYTCSGHMLSEIFYFSTPILGWACGLCYPYLPLPDPVRGSSLLSPRPMLCDIQPLLRKATRSVHCE